MKKLKIVITGPESVGKSTLTKQLAEYFETPFIAEIARNYITKLNRKYTLKDVENIANLQIKEEQTFKHSNHNIIFLDTDLIVTKVWFSRVYDFIPSMVNKHLNTEKADLHLLCYPDIEWKFDPLRENPNIRQELFEEYKNEIIKLNIPYFIVKGINEDRLKNAISFLKEIGLTQNMK